MDSEYKTVNDKKIMAQVFKDAAKSQKEKEDKKKRRAEIAKTNGFDNRSAKNVELLCRQPE